MRCRYCKETIDWRFVRDLTFQHDKKGVAFWAHKKCWQEHKKIIGEKLLKEAQSRRQKTLEEWQRSF